MRVSVEEAFALDVLGFLVRGRKIGIRSRFTISKPRREFVALGCMRLQTYCLEYLVNSGWREQALLRDGERRAGRLWDRELNDGFKLRFTGASLRWWLEMSSLLGPMLRDEPDAHAVVEHTARRIAASPPTDVGDWLFFALSVVHLRRLRLPVTSEASLTRALSLASPLARLLALSCEGGRLTAETALAQLLEPRARRLVECSAELLRDTWLHELGQAMSTTPTPARTERLSELAETLSAWLDCLEQGERLDQSRPVLAMLVSALDRSWSGSAELVLRRLEHALSFKDLGQRDALRRALAGVVHTATRLHDLREARRRIGYGDPGRDESRIFMADWDELLAPHWKDFALLEGALVARLG